MGTTEMLAATLADALDGATITDLRRLSGGASRETWRFSADGRALVVQRQRPGDVRDMLREAAVVTAAGRAGVPTAEVITAQRFDDGGAMMILAAVEGETIARKIQRDDQFVGARGRLVADLGRALAAVHRIDGATVEGLERIDQIAYYTDLLDELDQPHPVLELVRNWLLDPGAGRMPRYFSSMKSSVVSFSALPNPHSSRTLLCRYSAKASASRSAIASAMMAL
jgi:aminoglycoside phosphotransferase (APT) family kinase protein